MPLDLHTTTGPDNWWCQRANSDRQLRILGTLGAPYQDGACPACIPKEAISKP